jgi:hypothetical protein
VLITHTHVERRTSTSLQLHWQMANYQIIDSSVMRLTTIQQTAQRECGERLQHLLMTQRGTVRAAQRLVTVSQQPVSSSGVVGVTTPRFTVRAVSGQSLEGTQEVCAEVRKL